MGLVPIMLVNKREQVCEVSINSLQYLWRYQLTRKKLTTGTPTPPPNSTNG
jgi:hypothetical protein